MDDARPFLDDTLPYLDVLYRVARHAGKDHHRAEDLVQETYLRAFAAYGRKPVENPKAWLVTICLNLIRSEGRRRLRVVETPITFADDDLVALGSDVADDALARLDREAIAKALTRLPREQRIAIVLMDLASLSASEVAGILGCSRNTVLSRVHRGRKRLAAHLMAQDMSRDLS